MTLGVIVLLVVAILVYFGFLHRVLDRMRLDDRTALFILFLMVLGSFFNITILRRPVLAINVGGGIVPIGLAIWLIATADTSQEKVRGTVAALVTGAAIYASMKLINPEEQTMIIDPTVFYSLIAGVVGYLSGRSRRAAFIAGTSGIVLADITHYVELVTRGIPGRTWIGGAGVFDAVVIAGIIAVGLAEAVGETRELMARGPARSSRGGLGGGTAGGESAGRGGAGNAGREGESRPEAGGDDNYVAAIGIGAGRAKEGARSRGGQRAPRGKRIYGDQRTRPTTSGGAGWEAPFLGQGSGQEDIGSVAEPPPRLVVPGEEGAPEARASGGEAAWNETVRRGDPLAVTEPDNSLAPATGLDVTGIAGLDGGVRETQTSAERYGAPSRRRSGRRSGDRGRGGNGAGGAEGGGLRD